MVKFIRNSMTLIALTAAASTAQAQPASLYNHAVLNLPFVIESTSPHWVQVIDNAADWRDFYVSHKPDNGAVSNVAASDTGEVVVEGHFIPAIDFSQYLVVAGGLSAGTGKELVVDYVRYSGTAATFVGVMELTYGSQCNVAQVIQYPTIAIMIRRTSENVHVYKNNALIPCD